MSVDGRPELTKKERVMGRVEVVRLTTTSVAIIFIYDNYTLSGVSFNLHISLVPPV